MLHINPGNFICPLELNNKLDIPDQELRNGWKYRINNLQRLAENLAL